MNLSLVHRIPAKLIGKLERAWIKLNYDSDKYLTEQCALFDRLGLDFMASLGIVEGLYREHPDLASSMSSCHHNLFAALSATARFDSILEIGTHGAKGALLLSLLFPEAAIDTIDLPDDHPVFRSTYNRGDEARRRRFIADRNSRLAGCENVTFRQMDSLELTVAQGRTYDLIWVDGAHGYPGAAIDIANCVRLLAPEGIMACDDVYLNPDESDAMYRSAATYETLRRFEEAGLVRFALILKRFSSPYGHPRLRKYIAVVRHDDAVKSGPEAARPLG